MTREEAIKHGKEQLEIFGGEHREFIEMAIKALEQEPFINKPCVSSGVCEHDKQKVLDKIRAEIDNALSDGMIHKKTVLGIIDKYKAESEPQESEANNGTQL